MFKPTKNFPVPGVYDVNFGGKKIQRFVHENGNVRAPWNMRCEGDYDSAKFVSSLDGKPKINDTFPIVGEYECYLAGVAVKRYVHADGSIRDCDGKHVGKIGGGNSVIYKNVRYVGPLPKEKPEPLATPAVQNPKFWLVWCPNGPYPPSYRHSTEASAVKEAERMAKEHPASRFYVLEAKSFCEQSTITWTVLDEPSDCVPF